MSPRCLSIHAGWRCRQAGACCRAGWAIPVEAPAFEVLRAHFGRPRTHDLFVAAGPLPEGSAAVLGTDERGVCRLYDGRLCTIHRELGPQAMPAACQQFPRRALMDGRGTSITLSHFCPTAAGLLLRDEALSIVEAPAELSLRGAVEGLDASAVLPPLLRPGLLTDLAGYDRWERLGIELLASGLWPPEESVERIADATDRLMTWSPDRGSLTRAAADAFASATSGRGDWRGAANRRRYELARSAVPSGLQVAGLPVDVGAAIEAGSTRWSDFDRATRAFLASHLFGNWIAYHGAGLSTVVGYLRVCLSVLRIELARQHQQETRVARARQFTEAVRRADLLMVHLADVRSLVRSIEHDEHFSARPLSSLRRHRHPFG